MTFEREQILQNRYRLVSLLGQGGMGAVYRAWDTRLNVPVALKEMIPQPGLNAQKLSQLRQQFQHEARVLARLEHPNLVNVTDFFEEKGKSYLIMKFVEGENLAHHIKQQGAMSEEKVLDIAGQLLDALAYCHSQDIIHRDVKPQNVIIQPDGQVVLVDFGLVKLWDPSAPQTRQAIRGIGTPEYAPPEQYSKQMGHTDPRSDLYSLGTTLYHALTGQAPPTATDRMADPDRFIPIRELNPRVSPQTEKTISRAMSLSREERWQDANEMGKALGKRVPFFARIKPAGKERSKDASPPKKKPNIQILKRAPDLAWAVGGGALLALIVGAILVAILTGPANETIPTATPSPTPTYTLPPTSPPTYPPTETPRGPTVTPAPRATSKPPETSPVRQASATTPTLTYPEQGRTYKGPITFRWEGTLEAGQSYQVRAWHLESNTVIQSPPLSATGWTTDLPMEKAGEWRWEVSVLNDDATIVTSNERMFWFNPFGNQDGAGGGSGGGGSSPLATPDNR